MRSTLRLLLGLLLFAAALAPAAADELSLLVTYGEHRRLLTPADLADLPQTEVEITEDGVTQRYRGVLGRDLLALVHAPAGAALRGPLSALAVRATATDGYVVAYALAEFHEAFRPRPILLALSVDGAPPPPKAAPWRLVSPGDKHHSRWIRQVTSLEVISLLATP